MSDKIKTEKPTSIWRAHHDSENPYVPIKRTSIQDEKLSWGAKGLLAYCLSMKDDWVFYRNELKKHSPGTKWEMEDLIKELKDCGYLHIESNREKGRITGWITNIYEIPEQNPFFKNYPQSEKRTQVEVPGSLGPSPDPEIQDLAHSPDPRIPESGLPGPGIQPLITTNINDHKIIINNNSGCLLDILIKEGMEKEEAELIILTHGNEYCLDLLKYVNNYPRAVKERLSMLRKGFKQKWAVSKKRGPYGMSVTGHISTEETKPYLEAFDKAQMKRSNKAPLEFKLLAKKLRGNKSE